MITGSRIVKQEIQKDNRIYVTEAQTDDALGDIFFYYLADAGADLTAIRTARTTVMNNAATAVPTVSVTNDDGVVASVRTYDISNMDLRLTAGQKTALQTARTVLNAVKPLVRLYNSLTPAQQQFLLNHSPWFSQALDVIYGG